MNMWMRSCIREYQSPMEGEKQDDRENYRSQKKAMYLYKKQ